MVDQIGYDIVIIDDEVENAGSKGLERGSFINERIDNYIASVERTLSSAIVEGDASKNLLSFKASAEALKGQAQDIGNDFKTQASSFLDDFDYADDKLY